MTNETTFERGTEVTVTTLKSQHPEWTLHVTPGNRQAGAKGKVFGFFRFSYELFAVAQEDGSTAVYEADELALN